MSHSLCSKLSMLRPSGAFNAPGVFFSFWKGVIVMK